MIRILQCVNDMHRAGLETMLMNYYRNIDRSEIQFDFLTHRPNRSDYDDEIESLGGKVYYLLPFFKDSRYICDDELYKTNEQIHYAGQYLSTKEVQQQFTKAIFKKKFRAEHSKELDAYVESVKYFREENDGKLPSLKSLKKRKEKLTQEIAERKKAYAPLRKESRRLEIASDNVYSIFRKTNEMKTDLAWKREWEAKVREKARQEQARQEQRERQPKRKKRSYDMSL